jgi:hypothetical protein
VDERINCSKKSQTGKAKAGRGWKPEKINRVKRLQPLTLVKNFALCFCSENGKERGLQRLSSCFDEYLNGWMTGSVWLYCQNCKWQLRGRTSKS